MRAGVRTRAQAEALLALDARFEVKRLDPAFDPSATRKLAANSEVLPAGSVAVAVIGWPSTAEASAKLKEIFSPSLMMTLSLTRSGCFASASISSVIPGMPA